MQSRQWIRIALPLLVLPLLATIACNDGDFERPVPQVEIQRADAVYAQQDPYGLVTLAFFAERELHAPLASSYIHSLPVTGLVGPARRIKSIDVESRLWIDYVTVTTVDDSVIVFEVGSVEHRGIELHLKLARPVAQTSGIPY